MPKIFETINMFKGCAKLHKMIISMKCWHLQKQVVILRSVCLGSQVQQVLYLCSGENWGRWATFPAMDSILWHIGIRLLYSRSIFEEKGFQKQCMQQLVVAWLLRLRQSENSGIKYCERKPNKKTHGNYGCQTNKPIKINTGIALKKIPQRTYTYQRSM